MNILVKAVQDVMYTIPEEILIQVFTPQRNEWRAFAGSIEESILATVVRPRVIPDASIAKGEHMIIRLTNIAPKTIDEFRCIYEVPERLLMGKTILSVLDVSYAPYSGGIGLPGNVYGGVGPMYSQDVMTATTQMVEASSAIPNVSTARVELVGVNTVLVEDSQRFNSAYDLSCYVTDSNYMNKVDPRNFEYFSTLVEYAVKAHIYRKQSVLMDRGQVEGGSVIGMFKTIIDSYADAETNYRTWLKEKWAKVAFMDNRRRYMRFVRSQVPVGL